MSRGYTGRTPRPKTPQSRTVHRNLGPKLGTYIHLTDFEVPFPTRTTSPLLPTEFESHRVVAGEKTSQMSSTLLPTSGVTTSDDDTNRPLTSWAVQRLRLSGVGRHEDRQRSVKVETTRGATWPTPPWFRVQNPSRTFRPLRPTSETSRKRGFYLLVGTVTTSKESNDSTLLVPLPH